MMDENDYNVIMSGIYLEVLLKDLEIFGVKLEDMEFDESRGGMNFVFTIPESNTMSNPMFHGVTDMSDEYQAVETIATCVRVCMEIAFDGIPNDKFEMIMSRQIIDVYTGNEWTDQDVAMLFCKRAYVHIMKEVISRGR